MGERRVISVFVAMFAIVGICIGEAREAGSSRYRAELKAVAQNPHDGKWTVSLNVADQSTGKVKEISFANRTVKVVDMFPQRGERLVVHGELGSGGDIVTVVDLERGAVLDTLWGWHVTFCPDRTLAVYTFRYPPASMPVYNTTVVLAYDFGKPPLANSANGELTDPERRGFILYPEVNRLKRQYFIPALTDVDRRHVVSPFAWCDNNKKIAVLEEGHDGTYLVVIDISRGLATPVIQRSLLDSAHLPPGRGGSEAEARRHGHVVVTSLRFVDGCSALDTQLHPYVGSEAVRVTLDLAANPLQH